MHMKRSKRTQLFLAIGSTLLMVLFAQFVLGHYSACFHVEGSLNSLGLSFGYSSEDVQIFVEARSSTQLNCYLNFLRIWDSLFPILYTLMYVLWIIYLFKRNTFLLIIPLLHMVTDWIENFFEITMIEQYMQTGIPEETLISAGSVVTMLKWGLSVVTYAVLLYGIVKKLNIVQTTVKR